MQFLRVVAIVFLVLIGFAAHRHLFYMDDTFSARATGKQDQKKSRERPNETPYLRHLFLRPGTIEAAINTTRSSGNLGMGNMRGTPNSKDSNTNMDMPHW